MTGKVSSLSLFNTVNVKSEVLTTVNTEIIVIWDVISYRGWIFTISERHAASFSGKPEDKDTIWHHIQVFQLSAAYRIWNSDQNVQRELKLYSELNRSHTC